MPHLPAATRGSGTPTSSSRSTTTGSNLLLAWRRLGFDHNKEIEFEGCRFRPLDLLVSRLPKSVDLIGKMHGAVCVGTLAEGTIGGKRVRRYMYQITSHDEAYEKHGVQGTGWQTGVPAACGGDHAGQGPGPGHGVFAPGADRPGAVPRPDDRARHAVGRGRPAGRRGTPGLKQGPPRTGDWRAAAADGP